MNDIHPNFKAGHDNMMRIASTKKGKKIYGEAVGKAKSSALKKRTWHDKRVEHMAKDPAMEKDSNDYSKTTGVMLRKTRDLPR